MDEQKKSLLKEKFAQVEKAEDKKRFDRIVEDVINKAKRRRDQKILN
jgi:hypothetical protein